MAELVRSSAPSACAAPRNSPSRASTNSGHKLAVTWGTAPMLVKRIEGGDSADVVVLSRASIDTLQKQGKIAPGSDVALASSGVGIAVKAGAPKPDISTPEALKRTLLAAKSIAYSEPSAGGASGVYFAKLLERMGIAEQMKPKTKYPPPGGFSANLLMTDEAELAVQQKPELLHVAGAEVIGVARRSERGHGIRCSDHDRLQKYRAGDGDDQNVEIARSGYGVPREGARYALIANRVSYLLFVLLPVFGLLLGFQIPPTDDR